MATFSTNLRLTLPAPGEYAGSWGDVTNNNLGILLEQAVSGYQTQLMATGADTTLTIGDGSGTGINNSARNMYLELTGILTAAQNLIVPNNKKLYYVYNNTTNGFAVVVRNSSSSLGITVPNGKRVSLVCDGANVVPAANYFPVFSTAAIDGTPIGTTTAAAGAFTTLSATGALTGVSAVFSSTLAATTITGTTFVGDGAALTGLNATNLTTGTLPDARLAATVAKYADATANFTGTLQTSGIAVGYKNIPLSSNATGTLVAGDVGKQLVVSTGQIVPTGVFNAGDIIMVVNNSAASITLTTSAVTAYLGGVNTVRPSITIATRGQASINFVAAGTCFISGAGVS
jgi:hypothetical protein